MSNENRIITMDDDYVASKMRAMAMTEVEKAESLINNAILRGDSLMLILKDGKTVKLDEPISIVHTCATMLRGRKIEFVDFNTPNSIWEFFPKFDIDGTYLSENGGGRFHTVLTEERMGKFYKFTENLRKEFNHVSPPSFYKYYLDTKYVPSIYVGVDANLKPLYYMFKVSDLLDEDYDIYSEVFTFDNMLHKPMMYLSQYESCRKDEDDEYDNSKYIAFKINDVRDEFMIRSLKFVSDSTDSYIVSQYYVNPEVLDYKYTPPYKGKYANFGIKYLESDINAQIYLSSKYYSKDSKWINEK